MSYAAKFVKAKGQDCTIVRPVPFNTKASIKRSTRSSRDLGVREGYWEGLTLADANLQSGEVLIIGTDNYLVQSVNLDYASRECAFFAAKCNATLQHERYAENVDEYGNIKQGWDAINDDVPAYGEVVTYRLRQVDPGLLDGTKYIFQVPKVLGVKLLDRIVYDDTNYQVASIDGIGMAGVVRVQLQEDTRP